MADIQDEPFDFEEPEPIVYESDEEQFEQTVLFDQKQFDKPEPEQFKYETSEELLDEEEFSDERFWAALGEERRKRGLDLAITFNEQLHPRDLRGRWRKKLKFLQDSIKENKDELDKATDDFDVRFFQRELDEARGELRTHRARAKDSIPASDVWYHGTDATAAEIRRDGLDAGVSFDGMAGRGVYVTYSYKMAKDYGKNVFRVDMSGLLDDPVANEIDYDDGDGSLVSRNSIPPERLTLVRKDPVEQALETGDLSNLSNAEAREWLKEKKKRGRRG